MSTRKRQLVCVILPVALLLTVMASSTETDVVRGTSANLENSIASAIRFLQSHQNEDGGFGPTRINPRVAGSSDVGLTAFAVYAIARAPQKQRKGAAKSLEKGLAYLLKNRRPDGSFYDPRDPSMPEYKTSVALLALSTIDKIEHAEAIEAAQKFLKSRQYVEAQGFSEDSPYYGGFGYGGKPANLSVTKYATEALYESGLSGGDSVWRKVKIFLSRSQNGDEVDEIVKKAKVGTTKDWGFRYGPDQTRGPEKSADGGGKLFSSYGSMTYAGMLSFLYARVDKSDPRVKNAFKWISDNFAVDVNPGMAVPGKPELGLQGLYYYYHTMAKALATYSQDVLVDRRGAKHDWALELGAKLVSLQRPEGDWVNKADRWMEGIPTLTTCYALIAMSICEEELESRLGKD